MPPKKAPRSAGNEAKKRKRPAKKDQSTSSSPKKQASFAAGARSRSSTSTKKQLSSGANASPPTKVLVIDNGGDTLKFGWMDDVRPKRISNQTGKLRYQLTILVGDQLETIQPTQLESTVRSMERSHIVNLGNQTQVWKRVLEVMRVRVPLNTEAAQALGWKIAPKKKNHKSDSGTPIDAVGDPIHNPQQLAVLLLLSPNAPRSMLEQIYHVWFHDFGFGHIGIATGALMCCRYNNHTPAPSAQLQSSQIIATTGAEVIVDLGWSGIDIVPTYKGKAFTSGIRRVSIGGRHLINMWKYLVSYRQFNLMDADWLLRDVQHQLAYLSLDLDEDLIIAQRLPRGRRPYDRDFALPDFTSTFKGTVRLTRALRLIQSQKEDIEHHQELSPTTLTEKNHAENFQSATAKEDDDNNDADDNEIDSDEETEEDKRKRLLRQRQEEERLRRELEAEQQILEVSVERFTIPELLFRPSDAGLPLQLAGIHEAIFQSVEACPRHYQAALYGSIRLVGGLGYIPNFKERLARELRSLVPVLYDMNIETSENLIDEAWLCACTWVKDIPYQEWSISKQEWEANTKKDRTKGYQRQLAKHGGMVI